MVANHLRRQTSNRPIEGRSAEITEEAVDHHCANAWSTTHDAGPALTKCCFSPLCYLETASAPFTVWPEYSQTYFLLETYIFTQEITVHLLFLKCNY